MSVLAPAKGKWSAIFGGVLLCVEKSSDAVVISEVTYDVATEPNNLSHLLRRVPGASARTENGNWDPIISQIGGMRHLLRPDSAVKGELETQVAGEVVDTACGSGADPYVELLTTMDVGPTGGQTNEIRIDYNYDREQLTLVVPLTFVACGSGVLAHEAC